MEFPGLFKNTTSRAFSFVVNDVAEAITSSMTFLIAEFFSPCAKRNRY